MSLRDTIANSGDSDDDEDTRDRVVPRPSVTDFIRTHTSRLFSYSTITYRELKKRPMSYCLGTSSCLIVVFVVAVMMTVLANVPAVFLRLGETQESERDLVVKTGKEAGSAASLNYTLLSERLSSSDRYSYHAPRITLGSAATNAFPSACAGNATSVNDLRERCGFRQQLTVHLIDTVREGRAAIGKEWTFPPMGPGEGVLESGAARRLKVEVGDDIVVHMEVVPELRGAVEAASLNSSSFPAIIATIKIVSIVTNGMGKVANDDVDMVFLEYQWAMKMIGDGLAYNTSFSVNDRARLSSVNPYHFATTVAVNFPPLERFAVYNDNVYAEIQKKFVNFASPIVFLLGFNQVSIATPILTFMNITRFFSIFLGLLISVIILVLSVMSMVLIYSLMMVNIGTRTFELGIMRMVGMERWQMVHLILLQAQFFSIPAWVLGLLMAQGAYSGLKTFLEKALVVQLDPLLAPGAVGVATMMGLLLPMIASMAPIAHVTDMSLQASLDTGRSHTKAIIVTIERMQTHISWDIVGLGSVLAVFGFLIYYLFPLSLLSFNLALLFYIFFGILIGMLFGLVLLALNAQPLLERAVCKFFFFWEAQAIQTLVVKNLIAHRIRNRKTTIMYSMSLAFIIFITVAFGIQIMSFQYTTLQRLGGDVSIRGDLSFSEYVILDKALKTSGLVKGHTWLASEPNGVNYIVTLGRYRAFPQQKFAVAPNFWDVADSTFLKVAEEAEDFADTDVGMAEYLYSHPGSYRAVVATVHKTLMALEANASFMLRTTVPTVKKESVYFYDNTKPLAFLDSSPVLRFSKFPSQPINQVAVSLPTMARQSHGNIVSIRQMRFTRVVIQMLPGKKASDVTNAIKQSLPDSAVERIVVQEYKAAIAPLKVAETVLNAFFTVTTIVAMVMCFYSLMSSMHTNIHEQSKEIGILRAIGLQKFPLARLYVWEAFTLVMSSSISGCVIGVMVAYTMSIQQTLFTQAEMPFVFPWGLFLTVFIMGIVCSGVASLVPILFLLRKHSTVEILRRMVS